MWGPQTSEEWQESYRRFVTIHQARIGTLGQPVSFSYNAMALSLAPGMPFVILSNELMSMPLQLFGNPIALKSLDGFGCANSN